MFSTSVGVPNSRLRAPDLIAVMFTDRPVSDSQALKAWYCPGRIGGSVTLAVKSAALAARCETPAYGSSRRSNDRQSLNHRL